MFDQVFDNFRKATETTLQAQQDLFRQWMLQWPMFSMDPTTPGSNGIISEQARSFQKQWTESVMALMTKHCEALDTQYRAGIRTIEDALRTTEVKSPEEFRRLTEELWRKSFEVLKQTIENQIRDFQVAVEKWSELMTQESSKA
jgi:glutathione S-transferase